MDEAGFEMAHLVGNSLGGFVALQLAARGRARTVVALAPAGGCARGDESYRELLRMQASMLDMVKAAAPHADWVVLDGVGHSPQLDVPLETSELILGFARLALGGAR